MICKLTGLEGKPAKAHIIPESFYLIDKDSKEPLKLLTNTAGVFPKRSWTGVYDLTIVTQEGEKRFLDWDDYAYKLLVEQVNTARKLKYKSKVVAYVYDTFDYEKLKLFFLSVLWRAGVSSHPILKRVKLGLHTEILRKAICEANPGNPDFYSTILAFFHDDQSWAKIMDPFPERYDNIKFYRLYLGNIVAYIKVDKQLARTPLREMQLTPNQPLILITKEFWGSKENAVMKKIVANAH